MSCYLPGDAQKLQTSPKSPKPHNIIITAKKQYYQHLEIASNKPAQKLVT
jgi:hypothetical protein